MEPKKYPYLRLGVTLFVSLAAAITFVFLLLRIDDIKNFWDTVTTGLRPVIVGVALAYLLYHSCAALEKRMTRLGRGARPLSVALVMLIVVSIIAMFFASVLPQLIQSIRSLVTNLPGMVQTQLDRLSAQLEGQTEVAEQVMQWVESIENQLMDWIRSNMLSTVSVLSRSVLTLSGVVLDLLISMIVAIYLLLDRERYVAQLRKLFFAASRKSRWNGAILDAFHQANNIFSGFISGKLIDSLIVGVVCFICLTVMRMPYALLVSVIVGVTNIIPMFGPFIGAIPSAFLILLVSPGKCLAFLIFIVILQQIDGNVIGPRILGNSTGLSAFYVIASMLLFNQLLGFMGMVIGVPLFATLYYVVKRAAEFSLRQMDMPVETEAYAAVPYNGQQPQKETAPEVKPKASVKPRAKSRTRK
ncbi:MAG: AI-2E family transporter [Christensenellaceae bacterium]|nr:AI-2E family transporter [Christensenellaceae bacterium]